MRQRRAGFTLLELVIAMAVLMIVMGGLMQAFFGMRKAQGYSVSANLLKVAGQRAMNAMYHDLGQSRRLLADVGDTASLSSATTTSVAASFFARMERPTTGINPLPSPAPNTRFPSIRPSGGFGVEGSNAGEFKPTSVGNALVFVRQEAPIMLNYAGVKVDNSPSAWLADKQIALNTYRFVAYYMAEVRLPTGQNVGDTGRNYTNQLMRWESKPYFEKAEYEAALRRLKAGYLANLTTAAAALTMFSTYLPSLPVDGVWDSSERLAASAFYNKSPTGTVSGTTYNWTFAARSNPTIGFNRQTPAAQAYLEGTALAMTAFNSRTVEVPGLPVPRFGSPDVAALDVPFGFEVAITGGSGARRVLLNLSLAARLPSGGWFGSPHEQIVKVFDL